MIDFAVGEQREQTLSPCSARPHEMRYYIQCNSAIIVRMVMGSAGQRLVQDNTGYVWLPYRQPRLFACWCSCGSIAVRISPAIDFSLQLKPVSGKRSLGAGLCFNPRVRRVAVSRWPCSRADLALDESGSMVFSPGLTHTFGTGATRPCQCAGVTRPYCTRCPRYGRQLRRRRRTGWECRGKRSAPTLKFFHPGLLMFDL